ncbi:hypothetical protein [Microbacterium oleivorans]|uniref:hypothetical protein n=1 Tax=Microbacterium oleivorans TaxID=273677 RepID=UPI000767DBFC|nr:hypothetical protein [Microbacterium oleivorans]
MTDASTVPLGELAPASPASPTGPRVRWAAIVWGLTFAAMAAAGYAFISSPATMRALTDTIAAADLASAIAVGLLLVGALLAIAGVAGRLRVGQRSLAQRRMHQIASESTRQT